MRRLLTLAGAALLSFALDRWLVSQLFESNVVASLLSPSSSTAITSAVAALLFLVNRIGLYVAFPGACCALLAHGAARRWLGEPRVSEGKRAEPRAPAGTA